MKKGIGTLGMILIGILVIGTGAILVTQGIIPLSVEGIASGIAPLSLSQASFSSGNSFFNQKLWIMTVTQGGIGAKAIGTIDNEQVGTQSGQTPKTDLTIDITYSKQSCEYPISVSDNNGVYSLNKKEWVGGFCQSDAQSRCTNLLYSGGYIVFAGPVPVPTCFCIEKVSLAAAVAKNTINNPNVHTISTMKVSTGDGKSETGIFDTQSTIANYLGSNVYVQWNGDLLKNSCPSQAPWYGFYKDSKWQIGAANSYDDWKSAKDSLNVLVGTNPSKEQVDNLVNTVNSKSLVATTTVGIGQIPYIFGGTIQDSNSISGAKVIVDLKSAATNPVYTFYIKADWIGFLVPQPKPILVDATGTSITSGEGGALSITYRNDGDNGNVDVTATCDSGVSVSQNTQTFSMTKGQTKTSLVSVNGNTGQNVNKNCEICVWPNLRDNTQARQCKIVTVSLKPQKVCNANTYQCSGRDIYKCNEFGASNDKIKTCAEGQLCSINAQGVGECTTTPSQQCALDTDCNDNDPRTIDKCTTGLLGDRICTHDVPNPVCGDGQCDSRESKESCPRDCGVIPPLPPGGDLLPFVFLGIVAVIAGVLVIRKKRK